MYKKEQWPLTLYFDGDCPLCAREIKLLRSHASAHSTTDATQARLQLVDMSAEGFDAPALGFTYEQMQSVLHARFGDGTWVTGLDATLWSWRAAGLGAWAAPLSWRPLRPLLNLGYRFFCRWRPHLAWLPHPDGSRRCRDDRCAISRPSDENR
jgi:predicted DCC family thiol-disulfide oxidoreductase YuxK